MAICDGRVEVISASTLPFGLTPQDLTRDHDSRPRDPLLADAFFRRGLIERRGRGMQKIIDLCVAAGHLRPEFEERAGSVLVRFVPSGYVPPHRVGHDLSELQRRILHFLATSGRVAAAAIRDALDPALPDRTLRDDLKMLRELKLIGGSGHGRGARWWLVRNEAE